MNEKAQAGDEEALLVLQLQEQKIEPDTDMQIGKSTDKLRMKEIYIEKKGEILELNLEYKESKTLLNVALLEYITQKKCTHEVSPCGTVTFKIEGGTEISDDGKEISFADDAKDVALQYARAKWNLWKLDIEDIKKHIENNRLNRVKLGVFDPTELKREFVKQTQQDEITKIKSFWDKQKEGLDGKGLDNRAKADLSARIRNLCEKEINKLYMEQTVKTKDWLDFLSEKAQAGDEEALLILQSQEQKIEPDTDMQIGRDTDKLKMKNTYFEKREQIYKSSLQYTSKRRLLDVALLEYITQKECKYEVNSYGAIIFKVEDGAKIYDAGKKICFPNEAKELALTFARAKWGLYNLDLEQMGKLIDNNALSRDKAMAFDKFLKLEKAKQQQPRG